MTEWQNFFLGELGASAALAGLVFVGVSVNLRKITAFPQLTNRALQALVALVMVLFISSLLLIPRQGFFAAGMEVLLIGLIDWGTIGLLQFTSLRKTQSPYRGEYVRNTIPSQVAALCFVLAGVMLLIYSVGGLYWVVAAMLLSFLSSFIDAWVLLIEINR